MKIRKLSCITLFSLCLASPLLSQAGSFEADAGQASTAIDNANALHHEWRDSRQLLEKAEQLNKQGENDQAMQLLAQAKLEGEQAVKQAKDQADVNGPRQ